MAEQGFRIERDSMGELEVPETALWGAQTQRAVDNFPISGLTLPRTCIRALGLVKWAAAGAPFSWAAFEMSSAPGPTLTTLSF